MTAGTGGGPRSPRIEQSLRLTGRLAALVFRLCYKAAARVVLCGRNFERGRPDPS